MLTVDNVEEKLDFAANGLQGTRLVAYEWYPTQIVSYSGIVTAYEQQIHKIWVEEEPCHRLVTTVDGFVKIWTPWMYHMMQVDNLSYLDDKKKPFFPGLYDADYWIGARSTAITSQDGHIRRFPYFNVRVDASICYHPVGTPIKPGDSEAVQVTKFINEWWLGITNRNIIPTTQDPLGMEIYRIMKERGYTSATAVWKAHQNKPYLYSMSNKDIGPFLEIWGELSLTDILMWIEKQPNIVSTIDERTDDKIIVRPHKAFDFVHNV